MGLLEMVYSKNTATPYHQQDTDYYCGAATAQMILESIGASILNQDTLYNSNHSHNTQSGWATDPNGLNYTLNHYKPSPPTFNSYFIVETSDTELDGSKRIVGTLEHYKVATGTLVYHCGHWIAVKGFCTDTQPTNSTYSICGFYINNPWPPTPSWYNLTLAPPPPHSNTDGCGTGSNRGIANEYVSYNQWQNTYFTGCDVWGVGHNQYVSVCDPRLPKLGEILLKPEPRWTKGNRLITTAEIAELIPKILQNHCLFYDEIFAKVLKEAKATSPILVQRLDLPDTYYYLVPMATNEGVTALLSIDGLYGDFHGGQAFAKPIKDFIKQSSEAKASIIKRLIKTPVELGKRQGKLILREEALCFHPTMVWRPCQESRSPYYPFYMINAGDRRIYVGYDGKVHTSLHELLPGG
jgi:hypothetical protein